METKRSLIIKSSIIHYYYYYSFLCVSSQTAALSLKASGLATKTNKGKELGNLKAVNKLSSSEKKIFKYLKNKDVVTIFFLNYTGSLVFLLSLFQFGSLQPHPGLRLVLPQEVYTINDTYNQDCSLRKNFPQK